MTITDHDAIVQLIHRYGDGVRLGADRGADMWRSTWTEDATWDLPGRHMDGIDQIMTTWRTSIAKQSQVAQLYLSTWVDVQGDTATGRAQLVEMIQGLDGVGRMLAGHYDDEFRRTADGWKFTSRILTVYYRGATDLSGTFNAPEA